MPKKKTAATKQKKLPRIKPINNFALLMVLSVFQLLSGTAAAGGTGTFEVKVLLCTLALIVLEWLYVSVFTLPCTGGILSWNSLPFSYPGWALPSSAALSRTTLLSSC